jgi:hypothetical protein
LICEQNLLLGFLLSNLKWESLKPLLTKDNLTELTPSAFKGLFNSISIEQSFQMLDGSAS